MRVLAPLGETEERPGSGTVGFGLAWFAVTLLAYGAAVALGQAGMLFFGFWRISSVSSSLAMVAVVGCQTWLVARRTGGGPSWRRWGSSCLPLIPLSLSIPVMRGGSVDEHVVVGVLLGSMVGLTSALAMSARGSSFLVACVLGGFLGIHAALAAEAIRYRPEYHLFAAASIGTVAIVQCAAIPGAARKAAWLAASLLPAAGVCRFEEEIASSFRGLSSALPAHHQGSLFGFVVVEHLYLMVPGIALAASTGLAAPWLFPRTSESSL